MEDDWDLHAVVRGCTTTTTSSSSTTTTSSSINPPSTSCNFFSIFPPEKKGQVLSLSNPFEAKSSKEELHDLCKPFFLNSQSQIQSFQTSSPLSSFSYSSTPKYPPTQQQEQKQPHNKPHHTGSATTPRSKRRKNQLKKVCQVQAENLSSDIWAWRKYGQKPIKGSPHPRGYYRCSSSKGCLARKQVERNKSDPTMFIVTYTGEHNHPAPTHRNSLAGSIRQKPQTATNGESETKSPATSGVEEEVAPKSESTEDIEDLMKDEDEEQNEFGVSDMEGFFEGLEELTDPFTASSNVIASATAFGGS